ncbi:MAG TPA: site-2 protease family protein [Phycicoccus sp.]|jgi:membrane-associated protease RseP (regulator of RpoE activity)|nr:site-2 protease family protein [Phycicoccus sp.]HQK31389.1 site-2 protease family protein [Phycicoccus sp.]
MTWVAYVVGVLVAAFGVAASIALHEVGHLVPAKRFGVRVTQYMVGFGPTMWSRRRGETEYGVKAIPLGGYIRMIGMFPPKPGDDPGSVRATSTGRFSQLADEARASAYEELQPGDDHRVFYKLSTPKKLVVMLGGPTMNLLIAVVLLTGMVTLHGAPTAGDGAVVASVAQCVVPVTEAAATTTCEGKPGTPAAAAGLQPMDHIVSIDGEAVESNDDVSKLVRPRIGQSTPMVVERQGERIDLTITPIANTVAEYDDQGQPIKDPSGALVTTTAGFIGVTSATPVVYVPQSITTVPGVVGNGLWQTAGAVLRIPQKMVGVWQAATSDKPREIDSPMSVVGVGRVAGEVSAGKLDLMIGEQTVDKFWFLIGLIASLNLMLFVFNLIPLLPFDGGHVAGALWEGTKRQWARVRGKAAPAYVDVAKGLPIAYGVSLVLIGMSALLIYADLVNPIKLGG